MDNKLKELLAYITQNVSVEPMSGMMPWGPVWQIEVTGLLDEIARIWQVDKEEIGQLVNHGEVVG